MTQYSRELLKGIFAVIILKLLSEKDRMYGYEITQKVREITQDRIQISEGSLYPTLHKLVAEGTLSIEEEAQGKRIRKYYRLTASGQSVAQQRIAELNDLMQSLHLILNLNPNTLHD